MVLELAPSAALLTRDSFFSLCRALPGSPLPQLARHRDRTGVNSTATHGNGKRSWDGLFGLPFRLDDFLLLPTDKPFGPLVVRPSLFRLPQRVPSLRFRPHLRPLPRPLFLRLPPIFVAHRSCSIFSPPYPLCTGSPFSCLFDHSMPGFGNPYHERPNLREISSFLTFSAAFWTGTLLQPLVHRRTEYFRRLGIRIRITDAVYCMLGNLTRIEGIEYVTDVCYCEEYPLGKLKSSGPEARGTLRFFVRLRTKCNIRSSTFASCRVYEDSYVRPVSVSTRVHHRLGLQRDVTQSMSTLAHALVFSLQHFVSFHPCYLCSFCPLI